MVAKALSPSAAPLVLRVGLAVIVLYHGCLKLLAASGGVGWFPALPPGVQMAVAWTEVVAGLLLLVGLITRLAALALLIVQCGAIILVTGHQGFGLGGSVGPAPEANAFNFAQVGAEFNFAIIVMCLTLILLGSGIASLDHFLVSRRSGARSPEKSLQAAT